MVIYNVFIIFLRHCLGVIDNKIINILDNSPCIARDSFSKFLFYFFIYSVVFNSTKKKTKKQRYRLYPTQKQSNYEEQLL